METPTSSASSSRKNRLLHQQSSSVLENSNVSAVYVQDDAYSWLPARIVKQQVDGDENKVQVVLALPTDWHALTVLSPDSTILELEEGQEETQLRTVRLDDYPNQELPIQNVNARGQLLGKRDMADLPFLHEAAILYNLKLRHAASHPYTRVGDIVVAVNPCSWISHLYSNETRELYAKNILWKEEETEEESGDDIVQTFGNMYEKLGYDPHVYETSCLAYRGLALGRKNQTILVTGESGAGKTETVKIVMSHLATLEQTRPNAPTDDYEESSSSTTVERVLESNPVFEAFGNAKTLRNDNSSRFGKFTQLQFHIEKRLGGNDSDDDDDHNNMDSSHKTFSSHIGGPIPMCQLAGSVCITYLLEKSRVVSHSKGERTYHIFYQLLSAPNDFKTQIWQHLDGTDLESFTYLGDNSEYQLLGNGDTDTKEWPDTLKALQVFQYTNDRLLTLMRALCLVLQLGNINFVEDPTSDDMQEGGTIVSNRDELSKLEDISGIASSDLEQAMTTRILKTGYDTVQVRLRPTVAKEAADALAKEIYARIFDKLVQSINAYTQGQEQKAEYDFGVICLLDIFGFERFKVNRFEQLCINYANEHLQHKYVLDNFKQVQEEYEAEGIEIFDFAVVDNSDVLNLLENRLGIVISLNEECVRPKGNDESFVYKIKIVNKDHDRIVDEKLHRKTEFGIRHFAGTVKYDATRFVERNTDKLPEDLIQCAATSSNELVRTEFQKILDANKEQVEVKGKRNKKASNRTVLQKFRLQLKDLMSNMEDTTTRYIRCIKPNDNMIPKMIDHYTTMRQLECAGLVTAITISRESFPNRLAYAPTRDRFECLLTKSDRKYLQSLEAKPAVEFILSVLMTPLAETTIDGKTRLPYACGNTRVYFRAGALEHLETKRLEYYTQRVVIIQNWIRKIQTRERYLEMRQAAIKIQQVGRCHVEFRRYREKKQASTILASWVRGRQATALVQSLREERAATTVQTTWRSRSKAYQLSRMKKAAVIIQRAARTKGTRQRFTAKLAVAVEQARMDTKLLGLQKEVSETASMRSTKKGMSGRDVNDELLQEVETMFHYLRKEIFELRGKNDVLKADVRGGEEKTRELLSQVEASEASATASRIETAKLAKSSAALGQEIVEHRHEVMALRKELKNAESQKSEELLTLKRDKESLVTEKVEEVRRTEARDRKLKRRHELEIKQMRDQATKVEEGHVTEILRLKDELRRTQESHHDYLAKLMDVLETTHQAREQETARIAAELTTVKEEKDSQIIALKREVENVRRSRRDAPTKPEGATNEIKAASRDLHRSSGARQQRSQKFLEVSSRLMAAVSPDNLVAITSAPRTRGKSVSVVEEETLRMKKMIRFLGDLYHVEENSQTKINESMMSTMDTYMAGLEPNAALDEITARRDHLELENKRLREKVSEQGKCQRCEARDKRRMTRNRTNRSPTRQDMATTPPEPMRRRSSGPSRRGSGR